MTALVIDPSTTYQSVLVSMLEEHQVDALVAENCTQARALVDQYAFNLICMSVELADGDSADLCNYIRGLEKNHYAPILLLTSNYTRDKVRSSMSSGATDIFSKQDFVSFNLYLDQFCVRLQSDEEAAGRILYVEDNQAVAALTIALLEEAGHKVEHSTRAEDAIHEFEVSDFDLVLTDLLLAGEASGLAVVQSIRNNCDENKNTTPVIAISSFSDSARRVELFRAGINDYAQKPIINEELLARVNNLVRTQCLLRKINLQQRRLQQMAMSDQLTGLFNRHYMMEEIPKRISQALRRSDPLSLMVIDVDHFKLVNDTYGHQVGDKVLVAVAQYMKNSSRKEDVVARYGGEEFVFLLDNCPLDEAVKKAELIRAGVELIDTEGVIVTVSVGVSRITGDGDDFDHLFSRADKAVYRAKETGRNKVVFEL